jgi:hypothetical protein
MPKQPIKKAAAKKASAKPKASSSARQSVGKAQRKDKKSVDNLESFRAESSPITGAPMLDADGWNKDVNALAQMAKKYKLAKTDKQAYDVAFKSLKGWESQVEKKKKPRK